MAKKIKPYASRQWLNPEKDSVASIMCSGRYYEHCKELSGRLVLRDCTRSIEIHNTTDDDKDFVKKLRLIESEVKKLADWMEKVIDESSN